MFCFVIGGSASGKSEFAERLVMQQKGEGLLYYVATMQPFGEEGRQRVRRHQQLRRGKGFFTVEQYTRIDSLRLPPHAKILLECLGNLLANEMFSNPHFHVVAEILAGIRQLAVQADHLVVVSNDVFSDGENYESETAAYLTNLAQLNRILAKEADHVIEVVCGIPIVLKGML